MVYYESNELYHHGILGQKWGVRRYQNPDGTLTPAGKKRYGYIHEAGKMSEEASKLAYKKADEERKIQERTRQRYSGEDAWKVYAKDTMGTTTGKEYGFSQKEFESGMKADLKKRLEDSERLSKATIESYLSIGEKYSKVSKELLGTPISSITKDDMKLSKAYYDMFVNSPLEEIVEDFFISELENRY